MVEKKVVSSAPCISFEKVKQLPSAGQPNTVYYVKPNNSLVATSYITDTHGNPTLITGTEVLVGNFINLLDTPDSYEGQSLRAIRVNASETGLEFYDISVDGFVDLTSDQEITGIKTYPNSLLVRDAVEDQEPLTYKQFNDVIDVLAPAPNYIAPTASLSSTPSQDNLEIGTTISSITLTSSFTQNNAGARTTTSVRRNGTQIGTTSPYTDTNVLMTATPKVYDSVISYLEGTTLNNSVTGKPDARGKILAGSITTNSISYRGYYRIFGGSVASTVTNSAQARALPQNQFIINLVFDLIANTTTLKQDIVIPPGYTIDTAIDLTASGAPVEYNIINSNFTVNDAGGTPVTGWKLAERIQGTVYDVPHTHRITLKAE